MKKKFLFAIAFTFLILSSLYLYGEVAMDKLTTEENFSKTSADRTSRLKTVGTFFKAPTGIAFDSTGAMYVTNWSGNSVTKIKASGEHENVYTDISAPAGIAIDADDNIYISSYHDNYVLKIATNGKSQKISDGYHTPTGIALSNSGKLLITNRSSGEIIALDLKSGSKEIVAQGLSTPVGVTQLPDNSLVVSQYSGRLTLIQPNGKQTELGVDFKRPGVGIVTIAPNVVAVIDNGADMVRRVDVKTKTVSTIVSSLPGAVALAFHNNRYYIGTWQNGSVYIFSNN
ncbi:hypothetical protein BHC46_08155 [Snodgrassella alvi]|jgi:streptogramin lyase|uniref:Serine/threonine protein kinase n=1 Tax=Snodgrassella alvi TaxID=1196083 RepID=A0A2N9XBK8_9NEIS|nr:MULTISPECIES: serine/threonine protein kinase [Snodgrassella]PIT07685.1 hypothetical protein BGI31_09015 [Snodgrassella communis]PIT43959.1 hypothetical protein BHC46_11910 [Snodgrassella alvi]PIT45449.1 hypothetical protein BHC46_10135 [Snodgrassella alvi]PIT46163.1 hypothetical protein BHC46_08155 [Snodgrassella alvi]